MDNACQCTTCKSYCNRPGWPTPEEVEKMLDAGLGKRLMLDYWESNPNIYVLCPAVPGYENTDAPYIPIGGCTFFTEVELCEIHTSGFKPIECVKAHHSHDLDNEHYRVAKLWDTPQGKALIERWTNEKLT